VPHQNPPVAFKAREAPDVSTWNESFLRVGTKLSGRLNEMDVEGGIFPFSRLEDSCYYTVHAATASVDPDLRGNDWFKQDGSGPGDTFTLQDSYAWQGVEEMSVTLTTGEDLLVVFALVQHASWKGTAGAHGATAPSIDTTMRVQHALQIDSARIDETITGASVVPDPPPMELYRVQKSSASPNDFDWRHVQVIQDTTGINNAANPARLMTVFPAGPGSHTVEVVSRRLPAADGKIDEDGEGVYVQFFNRQLYVLRIKGFSSHGGTDATLDVDPWDDADVVSAASLMTRRFDRLQASINDLTEGNLERGALNHEHLPSSVLYAQMAAIDASPSATINSIYPGYGAAGAGPPNWTTVSDGAGNNLEVTINADFAANPGVLVVMANVEVLSVATNPASQEIRALGALTVAYINHAGTRTHVALTEVYVNAHNPDPTSGSAMADIDTDIPLLWLVDTTKLSSADRHMDTIQIRGATWDGSGGGATVDMKTKRGILSVYLLRGVTLT
jgi:hypothetical protein